MHPFGCLGFGENRRNIVIHAKRQKAHKGILRQSTGVRHARTETQLRTVRLRPAARFRRSEDLQLRMHILRNLRRYGITECLPKMRRRLRTPAHPAAEILAGGQKFGPWPSSRWHETGAYPVFPGRHSALRRRHQGLAAAGPIGRNRSAGSVRRGYHAVRPGVAGTTQPCHFLGPQSAATQATRNSAKRHALYTAFPAASGSPGQLL